MFIRDVNYRIRIVGLMALAAIGWGLVCSPAVAQRDEIDFNRARQLRERMLRGENLSAAERTELERAKDAFQRKQANEEGGLRLSARESIGLMPLTDLSGKAQYKGEHGGLYGGGSNQPPDSHLQAAVKTAARIQPVDAKGNPSPNGKIVLISVGMSNTTQEFQAFMKLAQRDPDRSTLVVLVDGAQGAMEASAWAFPERATRLGRPNPWTVLDHRLEQAGVTREQVQVAWIKQARANPASLGAFSRHARELQANLEVIVSKLKPRFPNLRIAYLSSRIYAGYAATPLNPEPYAYESAFAVRWLIQDQIKGKPDLNDDAAKGEVKAPLLLWGPYLWADGVRGRKTGDLVWTRDDLAGDGTHPSPGGQRKVAEQLLRFLKSDPTARPWFVNSPRADRLR